MRIPAIARFSGIASAPGVSPALAGQTNTIASSNVSQRVCCEIAFDSLIIFIGCLLGRWPRPRTRLRPWGWIGTDHFKLRHHPIVLVLHHMAMEHVHPHVVGEL